MGIGGGGFYDFAHLHPSCFFSWSTQNVKTFNRVFLAVDANILLHAVFPNEADTSTRKGEIWNPEDLVHNYLVPKMVNQLKSLVYIFKDAPQTALEVYLVFDGQAPRLKYNTQKNRKKSALKVSFFDSDEQKRMFRDALEIKFVECLQQLQLNAKASTVYQEKAEGEFLCFRLVAEDRKFRQDSAKSTMYCVSSTDTDTFSYTLLDAESFVDEECKIFVLSRMFGKRNKNSFSDRVLYDFYDIRRNFLKGLFKEESLPLSACYAMCMLLLCGNDFLPIAVKSSTFHSTHIVVCQYLRTSHYTGAIADVIPSVELLLRSTSINKQALKKVSIFLAKLIEKAADYGLFRKIRKEALVLAPAAIQRCIEEWTSYVFDVINYYNEAFQLRPKISLYELENLGDHNKILSLTNENWKKAAASYVSILEDDGVRERSNSATNDAFGENTFTSHTEPNSGIGADLSA